MRNCRRPALHLLDLEWDLPAIEAPGHRQVVQARLDRRDAVRSKKRSWQDLDPGVLALGFSSCTTFIPAVFARGDFLVNSGKVGQTISSSTATKMLPAEKVMVETTRC